jgi:hypothetical protein
MILSIVFGSSIKEMIDILPPQEGHNRGSISYTLRITPTQPNPGPAFGRHIGRVVFNDGRMRRIDPCPTHLPPVGIGVRAVVADHDLILVRNV